MRKNQTITFIICLICCVLLAGCHGSSDSADTLKEKLENVKETAQSSGKKEDKSEKKKHKSKKKDEEKAGNTAVPEVCYSESYSPNYQQIHIVNSKELADLSAAVEKADKEIEEAAKATGGTDAKRSVYVRRAGSDVFSFVCEYREPDGEGDYVEMRGRSYDTATGKELKITDVVKDEDGFYKLLSKSLYYTVMKDMMIYAADIDMADFDSDAAMRECLDKGRYGWVLDPQGVTFWFENVNAMIGHATACILFAADKDGTIFNPEYSGKIPDKWMMEIPGCYSDTGFDYDDNGTLDVIAWNAESMEDDNNTDWTSGISALYNDRYFIASEVCPGDNMPWSHNRAFLMHKDKKTVLLFQYFEEVEPVWAAFTLENDYIHKAGRVSYYYPEYAQYSDDQASAEIIPTDMSAIKVYPDMGGDETTTRPKLKLDIDPEGQITVTDESGKPWKGLEGSDDTQGSGGGLTSSQAGEIADNLGGMVCAVECHDYDGDGRDEAYVVTGSFDDMGGYTPEAVWFIASDGSTTKMRTDFRGFSMYSDESGYFVEYADKKKGFFSAECGGYGSGWLNLLFGVKDGKPYELDLSMQIEGFYQDKPGVFITLTDNYDDGHKYLITELLYDSATGQFKKGRVTDTDWMNR